MNAFTQTSLIDLFNQNQQTIVAENQFRAVVLEANLNFEEGEVADDLFMEAVEIQMVNSPTALLQSERAVLNPDSSLQSNVLVGSNGAPSSSPALNVSSHKRQREDEEEEEKVKKLKTEVILTDEERAVLNHLKKKAKEEAKAKRMQAQASLSREEKKKQKEEEKRLKQLKKEENMRLKEEKKKEKEEKKKEKEELKRKKEEEKKVKQESREAAKKQKEELKQQKEDRKRQKELKQKEQEEALKRTTEAQSRFLTSFVSKALPKPKEEPNSVDERFRDPNIHRIHSLSPQEIERQIELGGDIATFLAQFKAKLGEKRKIEKPKPTEPVEVEEILQLPGHFKKLKMKLLSFHDNRRPSYWGTFSKTSKVITGRRPFSKDTTLLDYEYDSDDEWESEPEGEDLGNSADEKEDAEEDSLSDEEDFLVPDGYLSEDEGLDSEQPALPKDEAEEESLEVLEKKRKLHREAKLAIMKKISNNQVIKPTIIGPVYDLTPGSSNLFDSLIETDIDNTFYMKLKAYQVVPLTDLPIDTEKKVEVDLMDTTEKPHNETSSPRKVKAVPDYALPDLVKLIHGNSTKFAQLVLSFKESHPSISKLQIEKKIKEIAVKEKRPGYMKAAWFVNAQLLQSLGIPDVAPPSPVTQLPVASPKKQAQPAPQVSAVTDAASSASSPSRQVTLLNVRRVAPTPIAPSAPAVSTSNSDTTTPQQQQEQVTLLNARRVVPTPVTPNTTAAPSNPDTTAPTTSQQQEVTVLNVRRVAPTPITPNTTPAAPSNPDTTTPTTPTAPTTSQQEEEVTVLSVRRVAPTPIAATSDTPNASASTLEVAQVKSSPDTVMSMSPVKATVRSPVKTPEKTAAVSPTKSKSTPEKRTPTKGTPEKTVQRDIISFFSAVASPLQVAKEQVS